MRQLSRIMDPQQLKRMAPEERHRNIPMGLGLFPQALPYLTRWRHLRWFLLLWLPNVITFVVLLPGHHRVGEHVLLAVLSPFFLAIAFVSVRSGVASSNEGTFFRVREPLRFWVSTAIPALAYIALTGAYYAIRHDA